MIKLLTTAERAAWVANDTILAPVARDINTLLDALIASYREHADTAGELAQAVEEYEGIEKTVVARRAEADALERLKGTNG